MCGSVYHPSLDVWIILDQSSKWVTTKIPASRAIRQSDVNVSFFALFMALYLLYLCQIVFGSPPNTSTSLWVFLSPWFTGRTNRSELCWLWYQSGYRFDSFTPHRKACDFVESGRSFSISWQWSSLWDWLTNWGQLLCNTLMPSVRCRKGKRAKHGTATSTACSLKIRRLPL